MKTKKNELSRLAAAGWVALVLVGMLAGCGPKGPLYEVRTDEGAPVWERTAALELANYVSRVVANRFTVGGESGVVFHVGDTAFARQHGIAAKDLKDDEWRVRSFGRDVGGGRLCDESLPCRHPEPPERFAARAAGLRRFGAVGLAVERPHLRFLRAVEGVQGQPSRVLLARRRQARWRHHPRTALCDESGSGRHLLQADARVHRGRPAEGGGCRAPRAADNVVIRLCDTHTSMAGSPSEEGNTGFRDNLVAWNKVAKNLMIWDYSICYTFSEGLPNGVSFPCASERHYPELYRMFRDTGVQGVFVEHEMNGFSDFHELKYFLQCKLAENPDADAEALTDVFMSRYYGAAGALLADYRRDLERIRGERHGYVTWEPGLAPFNYIRDEDMSRYQAMFEKAENLVKDDPTRLARVRHARTGLDTLLVHRAKVQVVYRGPAKPAPKSLPPPKEFADRRCYDFYAWDLSGKLVDDPESPVGQARRIDATVDPSNFYGLPFVVGYFNQTGIGLSGVKGLDKPAGKGYRWYRFQSGLMPPSEWIYMTRSWHISLRKGLSRLAGETLETWVSVKFTGPRYFPDDPSEKGKPSAIWVDRVIFAEPERQ